MLQDRKAWKNTEMECENGIKEMIFLYPISFLQYEDTFLNLFLVVHKIIKRKLK